MLLLLACAPDVSNAEIAVDPASIDLGPLEMSTVPESTDLTVTNTGAGDLLEVQASTGLAGLSVEPATLSLEAGVAGTVTVTWLGAASGAFGDLDGTVYLVSNAATSGYLEVPF